jgi:tetratricopeptide (TPR) repeat protein
MLGMGLLTKRDPAGALECFRKAVELAPKHAGAHLQLGMALQRGGDTAAALVHLRQAAKLDPEEARAHFYLGALLHGKGDVDGAVACFRRVIALTPKDGRAHSLLGELFLAQGGYAEARDSLRRGLRLLPAADGMRRVVAEKLQQCERYLALEGKLAEALRGGEAPADAADALTVAQMCQEHRKRYVAAARLYAAAFAAAPGLADLPSHPRYDAACAATLAAAGKGRDAALLPDKVVTMLRARALHWLRGELTDYARLADQGGPAAKQEVRRLLEHWRGDPDLAAVRDPQALARLPEAERAAWQALWRDVGSLLKRLPPGRR